MLVGRRSTRRTESWLCCCIRTSAWLQAARTRLKPWSMLALPCSRISSRTYAHTHEQLLSSPLNWCFFVYCVPQECYCNEFRLVGWFAVLFCFLFMLYLFILFHQHAWFYYPENFKKYIQFKYIYCINEYTRANNILCFFTFILR